MWLAYLLALCNLTAFKANMMLVALYSAELHADAIATGALFASSALAPILLGVYAGRLSDRIGMRAPMTMGSAGMALSLVLPWWMPGLPVLFLSSILLGGAYVFYHVAIHNMVGAISTPESRTRNFANYSLITSISYIVGPLVTGFVIERADHAAAFLALAAFPLIGMVLLVTYGAAVPSNGGKVHADASSGDSLFRNRKLMTMAVTSGLALTSIDLFQFYAPLHARSVGLSPSEIGIVLSMYAVAAIAVRLVLPQLSRVFKCERKLLTVALTLATVAYWAFPLFSSGVLLGFMAFLLGAGLGCAQPLSMMLTYNYSPPGRSGEGLGVRLLVNNAAHLVLPFSFGFITSAFGMLVVFWANAGILAGGAVAIRARGVAQNEPEVAVVISAVPAVQPATVQK